MTCNRFKCLILFTTDTNTTKSIDLNQSNLNNKMKNAKYEGGIRNLVQSAGGFVKKQRSFCHGRKKSGLFASTPDREGDMA